MRLIRSRKGVGVGVCAVVACALAATVFAELPGRTIEPTTVPLGTLAGATPLYVQSVDAFLRAFSAEHGTNAVLQHVTFAPGQSTLWHTHPGPNITIVVGGTLLLTDERCHETKYRDGEGFATGLKKHLAVAGSEGADFYSIYLLPGKADVLRTPAAGESADPPACAQK